LVRTPRKFTVDLPRLIPDKTATEALSTTEALRSGTAPAMVWQPTATSSLGRCGTRLFFKPFLRLPRACPGKSSFLYPPASCQFLLFCVCVKLFLCFVLRQAVVPHYIACVTTAGEPTELGKVCTHHRSVSAPRRPTLRRQPGA
jgi:hypothetical protein